MKNKGKATKQLPSELHGLAASHARVHANIARSIDRKIVSETSSKLDLPEVLALLVNAAFSIELYFKAFMLGGNNGVMTKGHELLELLKDLPEELVTVFSSKYSIYLKTNSIQVHLIAFKLGSDSGDKPIEPSFSIATFEDAISCLSKIFVDARYYFERADTEKWEAIVFPQGAILGILELLETTYSELLAGKLAIA